MCSSQILNDRKLKSYLFENVYNDNFKDKDGLTYLHGAVIYGNTYVVVELLKRGAMKHINDRSRYGWTPLHYAADHTRVSIMKILIDNGEDMSIIDINNRTPLHILRDSTVMAQMIEYDKVVKIKNRNKKANKLSKIIFLLCKKLQLKHFGVEPLVYIINNFFSENDIQFLKDYFYDNLYLDEKVRMCNSDNIIYILVCISTQEIYRNNREIPESFKEVVLNYLR